MKSLWNESTVQLATGAKVSGHFHASRVTIDSRSVQLGDLFVAIKGDRVDGHIYVADALARGAVAAVVSHVPDGLPRGAALAVVEDTFAALEALGRFARARSRARIVGVTGSVGKTSTKDMLRLALSASGKTFATHGNYNNHIGTPLNLANLPEDTDFAVFEMGMNHAGEIAALTAQVQPHVAVITAVEAVHLEFFPDVAAIADAKAEIFSGLGVSGVAIINRDPRFFEQLSDHVAKSKAARCLSFGEDAAADARLLSYTPTTSGAAIAAQIMGESVQCSLHTGGKHFALNVLSVLLACHALDVPLDVSCRALASFSAGQGRGAIAPLPLPQGGSAWLIDDAYNASPASMRSALARLREIWELQGKKGRMMAALGDMLELGKDAPVLHAALAEDIIKLGIHQLFTAGALMKYLHEAAPDECRASHVMEAKQLLSLLQKTLRPDDILLVKGSHGSKMYELSGQLAVGS